MKQEHDWQTVAIHYRERLFWVLFSLQLTAFNLFVISNEKFASWARYQMSSWYYQGYIWIFIYLACLGGILLVSKILEKLIFINIEQ